MEDVAIKPDFASFQKCLDEFPTLQNGWKLEHMGEVNNPNFPGTLKHFPLTP